ncbi:Acetyl-coenzyme A synthetase [Hondaea fermentalgiana]|uniref:Acetyl-coenzyme A synthetase n=1 Tax=Hondaea fermentalgiana TaxID=2315210 RepID=A0A2R5G5B2_9STRA|nr:Acetyl-coenzyme A synthetase [Hondaea fermentalgiana]|eukprot:GBG26216.1 Acetyl-coenzyme A synthetase [Hondaea fermentalgiana]
MLGTRAAPTLLRAAAGLRDAAASAVAKGAQRTAAYHLSAETYESLVQDSLDPATRNEFWGNAACQLEWTRPWDKVLDESNPPFARWFVGGELNVCHNAVDRWVNAGHAERPAIFFDSSTTGVKETITFGDLQDRVARLAGGLAARGVTKGDRVVIYMPMIPEAVVAMLACARLGAVHSVVFGGFAAKELATRIDDATPKAIITASCGVEPTRIIPYGPIVEDALRLAEHQPSLIVNKHREEVADPVNASIASFEDWNQVMENAIPHTCVPVKSTDPLYILYTSGTTGAPKGVVRDTGGYATALKWAMENFMDCKEAADTYWAASDIGWVVGHSFIVYGPLLHGCSTVMYEGKPILPDAGVFWRIAQDYNVRALFTAPTALRAIRKVDRNLDFASKYDLSKLKTLFLAGERGDPETVRFYANKLGKNVVDNWWQTELGWPALGFQMSGIGARPGSAARALPGFEFDVVCEESSVPMPNHTLGDIVIRLPLPPGTFTTLHNADERCKKTYYSKHDGYYLTGDAGICDEDGYFHIMARTDDVINCAGHRLSAGALEETLLGHPAVAEAAVIGAYDPQKAQVPVALVVLSDNATDAPEQIEKELVIKVRKEIGAVASMRHAFVVSMLPKTRSGKTLRNVMLQIADEKEIRVPGTIEDMAAVEEVKRTLEARWIPFKEKDSYDDEAYANENVPTQSVAA